MMAKTRRGKRGILLTLTMIVLFVLMLGEVITYIVLSISYDQLGANTGAAAGSAALVSQLDYGTSAFLSASLSEALGAVATYEGSPALRYSNFVNSTEYALVSLMTNGTIYGRNMSSYMGGATLTNYNNYVMKSGMAQQGKLSLSNLSISVYQSGPFTLTAKLIGLAAFNSSYGYITYGLSSTANASLNGTQDVYGLETGNPSIIQARGSYPVASAVGDATAIAGSRSPYMFTYGTLVYLGGTPTCSNVLAGFQNKNYILATPDAQGISSSVCGMGGLVTNSLPSGGVSVPYLVFTSAQMSSNIIQNGTASLLNGASLSLLDLTPLQTAIEGGYYYGSNFTPNYLQNVEGSMTKGGQYGMFSFNPTRRLAPKFNGASSYIQAPNSNALQLSTLTIAGWVYYTAPASGTYGWMLAKQNAWGVGACGSSLDACFYNWGTGSSYQSSFSLQKSTWYFLSAVIGSGTETVYVDGVKVLSDPLAVSSQSTVGPQIGYGNAAGEYLNGMASDIQIYNTTLAPAQISRLYSSGLGGIPLANSSLVAWYPLNGNANDYSGYGYNAIPENIIYAQVPGYQSDPLFGGLPNSYNSSAVKGVLNCANLNQCGNYSLEHLYLGIRALGVSGGTVLNESGALGIPNGTVPGAASLTQNAFIETASTSVSAINPQSITVAFWYNHTTTTQQYAVAKQNSAVNGNQYGVYLGTVIGAYLCSTSNCLSAQATLPSGDTSGWHFATITYNSGTSTVYLYIDGNPLGSGTVLAGLGALASSSTPLAIGYSYYSGTHWSGAISGLQIYDSALTSTQVMNLYQNNSVSGVSPAAYWPLSSAYNGIYNQTQDTIGGFTGYAYNSAGPCTNANVIGGTCGLRYIST